MTQSLEALFDEGIQRYKDGEDAATLLPIFKTICAQAPKNSAALTCLSWLALLSDKPKTAFNAAQKAVKLSPQDPQARVNLALASLELGRSGVRDHIDLASRIIMAVDELNQEIKQNLEEGLQRKPDWKNLQRVKKWLYED